MAWEPGQSGNPSGGSKRDKFVTQHLISELQEIDAETKAPRVRKLVKALIEKAEGGDIAAIKEVIDRAEGKAEQIIGGNGENPIGFTINIVQHSERVISAQQLGAPRLPAPIVVGSRAGQEASN